MFLINKLITSFGNLKKNKKGASSIEIVIGGLILVMLLAFLTDLLLIGWKFSVISQTTTQVARTVGIQGGLLSEQPEGYEGDYRTANSMRQSISNRMNTAGIDNDNWTLSVGGRDVTTGVSNEHEYLSDVEVEITGTYEWIVGTILPPLAGEKEFTSRRIVTSEWNYDWENWGEQ